MKHLPLLLAGTLFLANAAAQEPPSHKKLSPVLQMLISGNPDHVNFAKAHIHLKTAPQYTEPMVDAFVRFQGDPKALEAYGVRLRTVAGGVATADIPISALEKLANDSNVVQVQEARPVKHELDVSVPETGANKVWGAPNRPLPPALWSGNTGQGVVVGIVDSGIDLSHPDFKDATGKTRILSLWDQSTFDKGTHPAGFAYGNECTSDQINALYDMTDLVAANANDNTVSILLNNGSGTFAPHKDFAAGGGPNDVAVGDFNGDGILDLAVPDAGSDTLSILLGNGDGTFGVPSTFPAGRRPTSIVVADFNGDGKLDLALGDEGICSSFPTCNIINAGVSILLGNGDGTFGGTATFDANKNFIGFKGPPINIPVNAGTFPVWIAVGDFNGDGKPDLAVAVANTLNVSIYLGNGDGTFVLTDNPLVGNGPIGIAVGDFNGDGIPDLAVANEGTCCSFTDSSVSILLGNGNGTFGAATNFAVGMMIGAISIAAGDFTGHGKLDLAVTNFKNNNPVNVNFGSPINPVVSILLGQTDSSGTPNGSFGPPTQFAVGNGAALDTVNGLVVGDFNKDGKLDLAAVTFDTGNNDSGSISILLGDGTGAFGPPTNSPVGNLAAYAAVGNFHSVVCTEMDEEGHGTHVAGIAAGNGSATFNGQPAFNFIGMAPKANLMVVKASSKGDSDNDMDTDIVDGVAYIVNKAAGLGLPVVVNMSDIFIEGPRDGTSMPDTMLDDLTGPGKVIVVAAGNEAQNALHASGAVLNGTNIDVLFQVNPGEKKASLDIWYPGSDGLGVEISPPSGTCLSTPVIGFLYPGASLPAQDTRCGQVTIETPNVNATNGDYQIHITIEQIVDPVDNVTEPVGVGRWTLILTGAGCSTLTCGTGRFDAWAQSTAGLKFIDHVDPFSTLADTATATNVISVGSYMTKNTWTSGIGVTPPSTFSCVMGGSTCAPLDTDTLHAISNFSSLGPRRFCTSPTNPICSEKGVQKPELAAPGEEIMSSFAAGTNTVGRCFDASTNSTATGAGMQRPAICLDSDGRHIIMQGTSQAAPHVTGAVALLLLQNSALTADQVKALLTANTRKDAFTESLIPTPNDIWGYGKLAIDLAINALSGLVAVPHVVGLAQADAQTAIVGANLVVGIVTEASSPTVPKGNVISENPAAGTQVNPGSPVDLVVSCGTGVPNVVGVAQAAAEAAITTANLAVGTVTQASSKTVQAGNVISEDPAAGTCAAQGSAVNLVVSCGTNVPNVVGLAQAAAEAAITAANLAVGTVTQDSSTTVQAGDVISEAPAAGTCQLQGSAVNLVVSCGTKVPVVVGLTQAAAQAALTAANLVVGNVTQASSTTVPKGNVISQNPAAGSCVALASAVDLVVSSGTTVPNVLGQTEAAADAAIAGANLVVGTVTHANSPTVPAGNVISENPAVGTSVDLGSSVDLVISSGPLAIVVPNVVGQTQAQATTAIQNAGLVLGTVTQQSSNTVAAGNVISENPAAGTMVNPGSAVKLVVSSGPPPVAVPNVVGQSQAAATTAIQNAGLVLGTVTQQSSNTVAAGNVISENPPAGTIVNLGSAVNLVVSSGPPPVAVPNVVGQTQAQATTAIQNAGLVLGTVTQQSSNTVAAGNVISENPAAGTMVNSGSAVNLVVSSGPAVTDVTAQVTITRSGLVFNRGTNTFDCLVTITNSSASVLNGPLIFVINQINPASVTLSNANGVSSSGSPFVNLAVPAGGLAPGQSISNVLLKFSNPNRVVFTFTNSVLALH